MFLSNLYYDCIFGKIKCAALKKNHKIYYGKTHSDCFIQAPKGVLVDAEQGFLTDKGKFVNRKLALRIARHYNQIKFKHPPLDKLLSEDIL